MEATYCESMLDWFGDADVSVIDAGWTDNGEIIVSLEHSSLNVDSTAEMLADIIEAHDYEILDFNTNGRSVFIFEVYKREEDYSADMCAACDVNLATCETIWAAEGSLYCSRECGIHDLKYAYGDDAEKHFDEVAEEISPRDIGIKQ